MIIDNNHRIAAQIQQIGHTKIVWSRVFNLSGPKNGIFAIERQSIARDAFVSKILISVDRIEQRIDRLLKGTAQVGLLKTENIGILLLDVIEHFPTFFIRHSTAAKEKNIVRHHLDSSFGCCFRDIKRYVRAHGCIANDEAHQRKDAATQFEESPENKKSAVDD